MNRRGLLEWLSRALAAAGVLLVGLPGIALLSEPLRRRGGGGQAAFHRVARLSDLAVGVPWLAAVVGSRRDAWTLYPREVIGHAWLVRRSADEGDDTRVDAYTDVCPHLGCSVQLDADKSRFVCPCHKAVFDTSGEVVSGRDLGHKNPAPRGMDSLECRVIRDEVSDQRWIEVKYEKFQYGLTYKVAKS